MTKTRTSEEEMKSMKLRIHFWESKLKHDKHLMDLSTAVIIQETITDLKELREIRNAQQRISKS